MSNIKIDRQGFLDILAEIWPTWASSNSNVNAAKRVGITSEGLDWRWMQTNRFAQTEAYIQTKDETDLPTTSKPTW